MVQTPQNLRKCLPNFKRDTIPLILAFLQAKNNGKILGLLRGIFFYLYVLFCFIWKLFVHVSWSPIGTLNIPRQGLIPVYIS